MATDNASQPTTQPLLTNKQDALAILSVGDIARAIIAPLASLRLTVVLIALAILVTFIATLEQTRADIYDVKMRHFSGIFVEIPFQVFFVPAWTPIQNVPGRFFIPSGITILSLMLINLTAAHLMRFKLQATGARLLIGLVVSAFAAFVTWAVVFNGQNSNGFQAKPPIPYESMWILMQLGLLVILASSIVAFFLTAKELIIEKVLLVFVAVISGVVLGVTVYFGEKAFIGEAAMRVMWQLIQATLAALVAYAACVFLFKRKAGMVLLHLGVAALMMNEIFVTVTNNEQRMTIFEKETVSHAIDIREAEMAVINFSDPEEDEIIVVPNSLLKQGAEIADDSLPFNIRCLKYLSASKVRALQDKSNNLATHGIGLIAEAIAVSPVAGTDSEQIVDFASAYVELLDKRSGASLGSFLISQDLPESRADKVTVDGKDYFLQMRFKTEYKPYSIFLDDAQRENYPGTDTPKYYGSEIVLNDFQTKKSSEQRIFMNNPLRYSDETFYQAGMDKTVDGREYTILQIVTNVGWMIPYVCCMFSVVGLVAQFGESLIAFLRKQRKKIADRDAVPTAEVIKPRRDKGPILAWLPALVMVLVFGLWGLGQLSKGSRPVTKAASPSGADASESTTPFRLDLLGRIPVTFEGRVQPLGSYAINTARQVRERENITDGENESQPAIRWLADIAFGTDDANDYRTFYITDPNIINALGLPKGFPTDRKRKQYVYTVNELMDSMGKLNELIPNPRVKNQKDWTQLESRLALLRTKLQRVIAMQFVFGTEEKIEREEIDPSQQWMFRIDRDGFAMSSNLTPYLIPVDDEDRAWMPMTEANSRLWLAEFAKELDAKDLDELTGKLIDERVIPTVRTDRVREQIIQRFMSIPEFVEVQEERYNEKDPARLAALIKRDWEQLPESLRTGMEERETPLVDLVLQQSRNQFVSKLRNDMLPLNGNRTELGKGGVDTSMVALLNKLRPAYLSGDAETFNNSIEAHLANLDAEKPLGYSSLKLTTERYYNSFTPFYVCTAIYLAATLFAMTSWLCFAVTFLRNAMARTSVSLLLLGMIFHTTGLVMRVVISGRPPVTNLYSSVLFVSLAAVALLLLVELATRLSLASAMAGWSGFAALIWAHSMTVLDGDTFTVMVAVLDTTFWLATHVVCISLGYAATFAAGLLGAAYIIAGLITPAFRRKETSQLFVNIIYGIVCFGLLASYFGTVLGGLWGDDSWGRFWGWDPKENGALMIVLANALILHARWGGMVKDRGLAALAVLGNIIVLWSWKGVNAMGVGLHAYAGTEDNTINTIVVVGLVHVLIAFIALIPSRFWMSKAKLA